MFLRDRFAPICAFAATAVLGWVPHPVPAGRLARAGRRTRAGLYLRRGKVRAWLPMGFVVVSTVSLAVCSRQGMMTTAALLGALPWILVFAWGWGFLIQRTESLWGAVQSHAGADLMIVQGIISVHGAP